MDQKPIEASVVICAYTMDRWDDLNAAVDSVRRQTHPAREIFVVIDYNDELLQRAKREIAGAIVVPNTEVRGLCGGRMTGGLLSSAPVTAFLDDDAIAAPCWIEELLVPYQDERVLGVGGHIEPLWRAPRPSWFPAEFNWVVGCTYKGMRVAENGEVRNMIGANMSVRTNVLREVGFAGQMGRIGGGKDSANTCDDTEFCIRAAKKFRGIWIHRPKASVQHAVTPERTTWNYFMHRCRMEGTSKAVLAGLAGTRDGLGSERRYVWTLAQAVLGYLVTGRIGRATAVSIGLATTTFAYFKRRRTSIESEKIVVA